jgi:hypothetical protein
MHDPLRMRGNVHDCFSAIAVIFICLRVSSGDYVDRFS